MYDTTFSTTVEVEGREIDVVVHYTFSPGRPAPPCSNPSDPRFSDPGDAEDVEVYEVRDYEGVDITDRLDDATMGYLDEQAGEAGREAMQDAREEYAEKRADFIREISDGN